MLQVRVHDACINLHNCMLWDWYNNIPNCDCEHGISYCSTYYLHLCFSEINRFCMDFVSSRFCWVICSLSAYQCLEIFWGSEFHNLPSFCNRHCKPRPCTWTAARIFAWDPHMWVLSTAGYLYNKLLDKTFIEVVNI